MAKKERKRKSSYVDPYYAIANPLISKAIPTDSFERLVARFFFSSQEKQFKERLRTLLTRESFRSALNAYCTQIEDFFSKPIRGYKNIECSWTALIEIFLRESNTINQFLFFKKKFESSFLIGDYSNANIALDAIKVQCGESLWYIRSKSLLLSHTNNKSEFDRFSDECQNRATNSVSKDILKHIRIFNDSKDAYYPLKNILKRIILEFKEGGFHDGAATYTALFVPYPILSSDKFDIPLNYLQYFPLVDQYSLLIEFIQKEVVKESGSTEISKINAIVEKLITNINDEQLEKITCFKEPAISNESADIFRLYVEGNYEKVIYEFERNLSNLKNPFIFINIISKSYAILDKRPYPDKNFIYLIIDSFISLYNLSKSQKLLENSLFSFLIKLKHFSLFPHLQASLYFALPNKYENNDLKLSSHLALLSGCETNPIVKKFHLDKTSRFGTYISEISGDCHKTHSLKLEITSLIETNQPCEVVEEKLNEYRKKIQLKKDYLELFCEYCLIYKKFNLLIKESVDSLLKNPEFQFSIPLSSIVDLISEEKIVTIESIYLVYFFNKNSSSKKEEILNELFEDYLFNEGVEKPSELIPKIKELSQLDVVFLTEICSIDMLDFLTIFSSSTELLVERVKILDLLLDNKLINQERRLQEVELIVSEYLIESTSKKLNEAKIYVNEIAIIKNNQDHVQLLINQFNNSSFDDGQLVNVEVEPSLAFLTGPKDGVVVNIIKVLRDAFINDDKYGLDKNLSTEIRHGFFADFIRAKFLEKKLLTQVNDKNGFETNEYWREKHSIISDHILDDVDKHLQEFSRELNLLLTEAEEWMKVLYSSDQKNRFFKYNNLDIKLLKELKSYISNGATSTEVCNYVMNLMWHITENCLTKLREKINTDFRAKINQLLDTFKREIDRSKRGTSMKELTEAIAQAKSEIQEVVSTVAEWFKRTNSELESRNFNQVLEIAAKTFKSIKGTSLEVDLEIDTGFTSKIILGKNIKSYVIAIFNLLDNALRHSGLGEYTKVRIIGSIINSKCIITIINNLSLDKSSEFTDSYIESIRNRLKSQSAYSLTKIEGGSGLAKALTELKMISIKIDMEISCEDHNFIVRINVSE